MDCITPNDRQAIESLCRICEGGRLAQLREDFAFRQRVLLDYDALATIHSELAAEEIGRTAADLLGISADHAELIARELIMPSQRRQLALEMIREADPQNRSFDDRRQHNKAENPTRKITAVDRTNRHAAAHRNKARRRASA